MELKGKEVNVIVYIPLNANDLIDDHIKKLKALKSQKKIRRYTIDQITDTHVCIEAIPNNYG